MHHKISLIIPLRIIVLILFSFLCITSLYAQSKDERGTNRWIGTTYYGTSLNSSSWFDAYYENEEFTQRFGDRSDRDWVMLNRNWFLPRNFSIKYRMRSTKAAGCYTVDISPDDGAILTVEGTKVFEEWKGQGASPYTNLLFQLDGDSNLDLSYYEGNGGNSISFLNFNKLNRILTNQDQIVCSGIRAQNITASNKLAQSKHGSSKYERSRSTNFSWEYRIDGGAWQTAPGTSTNKDYRPPVLNNTTNIEQVYEYRRTAVYVQNLPGSHRNFDKTYTDRTAIATVRVKPVLGAITNISGPSDLMGGNQYTFTLPSVVGSDEYEWQFPAGFSVVSGNNTNNVRVQLADAASSGNIRVRAKNSCHTSNWSNLHAVTVTQPALVSLLTSVTSMKEEGGYAILTVRLNKAVGSDVLVELSFSGTAINSDYSIRSNILTIEAGDLEEEIILSAVNDREVEANETVVVDIKSVTNAKESGTQEVTVVIENHDTNSNAKISVSKDRYNSTQLVNDVLVTGCLTADNIHYSGEELEGLGYFEAGSSDFPIESGIIMSTGRVSKAPGPDKSGSNESDTFSNNQEYDSDINILKEGKRAYDAQILEFDFVPAGDKLEFRYVFASDEYYSYSCSNYNDMFAFILSGPGITADPGLSGKNIAILPGTNTPVSINSANNKSCGQANKKFFVNTRLGKAISFNGRTTTLKALADVVPCETYHIRLIVFDRSDAQYNSAVFLQAESFKTNEIVITNGIVGVESDVDFMYEGCDGSFIKFEREPGYVEEIDIDLNITGSAENGIDYIYVDEYGNKIGNGKIPDHVSIPVGVNEVVYRYKAISDSKIEKDEDMRISFLKSCRCSTPEFNEKVVRIIDVPEIEATPTSLVSCRGATPVATITINLKSGLSSADYRFKIDGGAWQDNNVFSLTNPPVGSKHTVIVEDKFGCNSKSFEITIPPVTPVNADAGDNKEICKGGTVQLDGSGGIYYKWTSVPASGVNYLSDVNISNPQVRADIPKGTYTYTLTVKESPSAMAVCISTDDVKLKVKESPIFTISTDKAEYCSGEEIQLNSSITNSKPTDTYLWTPVADVVNSNAANTTVTYNTNNLKAKDFSFKVTKANGCTKTEHISGILINPNPVVDLYPGSIICTSSPNSGKLIVNVTGGTPADTPPLYQYRWNHNPGLNTNFISNLANGSYTIRVTDAKSCKTTKTFNIESVPVPSKILHD
ncbi:MAG: choice-of-anchor L domain-containing protein [Marinifilaceae bacterium]|jgi:hypothetical protein|nr:choice-of-anchor L domain-containing protein [Marinifilaceae bacterium]